MTSPIGMYSWFRYSLFPSLVALVAVLVVPSTAHAAVNTFKTVCSEVQTPAEPWADDAILFPGQFPAGPDQEFFGNTLLNASSNGSEMVTDGGAIHTTCMDRFDTAGYWVPTLYRDGVRIVPTGMDAYYARIRRLTDAAGNPITRVAVPPTDFRMSAGLEGATTTQKMNIVKWRCIGVAGGFQVAPPACPSGHLGLVVRFPSCWDGQNDRVANNTNNVAYVSQSRGGARCPSGYSVAIPEIMLTVHYDAAPALPDCHLVVNPQDGQNCYVYTLSEVNPITGQRDDQGSIYGGYGRFLNGWAASTDPSGKDFSSLIQNVDNAPDGTLGCTQTCTATQPTGDSYVPIFGSASHASRSMRATRRARARSMRARSMRARSMRARSIRATRRAHAGHRAS
jgi:hypothetical protein